MEELPGSRLTLDYLDDQSFGNPVTRVRTLAACLGLSASDLDKRIEVLSGGEKARVSLTRILLSHPGLLLLDEPTNHLDLEACDALKRGLSTYEGTLLVVSHNRDFLDSLVDYILEIRPGEATLHHGNYSDWLARQEGSIPAPGASGDNKANSKKKTPKGKKSSEQKRLEAQQRQQRSDNLKQIRKHVTAAETDLKQCNEEIAHLDEKLCLPESPQDPKFPKWLQRHAELKTRLDQYEKRWLEVSEELERIDARH
jgi:ATP-binding cassette subfamily F protein 3